MNLEDALKKILQMKVDGGSGDAFSTYMLAGSIERAKMFLALFQHVADLTVRLEKLEERSAYNVKFSD